MSETRGEYQAGTPPSIFAMRRKLLNRAYGSIEQASEWMFSLELGHALESIEYAIKSNDADEKKWQEVYGSKKEA